MSHYNNICLDLKKNPKVWLITGVAGFIGSNLLEKLLLLDQDVIGLDNLSSGYYENLEEVKKTISTEQWSRFKFFEGDIEDRNICNKVVIGCNYVLHQAASGSVPKSIEDPVANNNTNINGFLNMLEASKNYEVKSFIYAASSATYGDNESLPKKEADIGNPLSPYALTKLVNELYAGVYAKNYNFDSIGLRYFNVFGKRQDPNGPYSAVIPKWIKSSLNNERIYINGKGDTSRDYCHVDNVVQANIIAALAHNNAKDQVYNIAFGDRTSLNELYSFILEALKDYSYEVLEAPIYRKYRDGDIRHSQADISKAKKYLNYEPIIDVKTGLKKTLSYYIT